jgi:ActR/RegA family two-component response regulator
VQNFTNEKPILAILDDEHVFLKTLHLFLTAYYNVFPFKTYEDLINNEFEVFPSVLVIDRFVNGKDILEKINDLRMRFPTSKVLILTGDANYISLMSCVSFGVDDFVIKSETCLEELLVRIPLLVQRGDLNRTHFELPNSKDELSYKVYKEFQNLMEALFLKNALNLNGDNITETAKKLGISRVSLSQKLSRIKNLGSVDV